jgi:hypothetical protein
MSDTKKPNLEETLKKIDMLPDYQFGDVNVDIKCLPKISTNKKIKALKKYALEQNYEIDHQTTDKLRKILSKNKNTKND